ILLEIIKAKVQQSISKTNKRLNMKKITLIITIALVLTSCNFETKKAKLKEENIEKQEANSSTNGFDLLNLKFNETITDILKSVKLNLKDNQDTDAMTSFEYKKFETTSNSLLILGKEKLAQVSKNTIIHYNETNNQIGMIQIDFGNQTDLNFLRKNLGVKLGTIKSEYNLESIKSCFWLNNSGIYYYYFQKNDKTDPYNILFVFKDKVWIDFISNLGYGGEFMKK
ncbi:lipoprotein, partial [Flavobacterium oreochromis]